MGATLVTGAAGCIGAWVAAQLVAEGVPVVAFDRDVEGRRLSLVLGGASADGVTWVAGDVTDLGAVERVLDDHGITSVIHLAALQAPACRADPPLGARVNVVGTVSLLEAVARRSDRMGPFVHASSVAASVEADGFPSTIYGAFKLACEGAAAVYARDRGVVSIGLRPHTVYGVGRDQGLTSAPTRAMVAVARGEPFLIPFTGRLTMQYAADVAAGFVAASRARDLTGSSVFRLPGTVVDVQEIVDAIGDDAVAASGEPLPFAEEVHEVPDAPFAAALPTTTLRDGVAETLARFRDLIANGCASALS